MLPVVFKMYALQFLFCALNRFVPRLLQGRIQCGSESVGMQQASRRRLLLLQGRQMQQRRSTGYRQRRTQVLEKEPTDTPEAKRRRMFPMFIKLVIFNFVPANVQTFVYLYEFLMSMFWKCTFMVGNCRLWCRFVLYTADCYCFVLMYISLYMYLFVAIKQQKKVWCEICSRRVRQRQILFPNGRIC